MCKEEDANEKAGWWKEGHENIGNPGWGSSTCETPPFKREPLEVQYQKGTQVVTKRIDGPLSMVPYQTSEEASRWKPRPYVSQGELPNLSTDPTKSTTDGGTTSGSADARV